jgi:hypothetical protein
MYLDSSWLEPNGPRAVSDIIVIYRPAQTLASTCILARGDSACAERSDRTRLIGRAPVDNLNISRIKTEIRGVNLDCLALSMPPS